MSTYEPNFTGDYPDYDGSSKTAVRNPLIKSMGFFGTQAAAERFVAANPGYYVTYADACSKCGGEKDSEGNCANYCMDSD